MNPNETFTPWPHSLMAQFVVAWLSPGHLVCRVWSGIARLPVGAIQSTQFDAWNAVGGSGRMEGDMRVHDETDAQGITYILEIEPDEIPVRGNALASGDDAEDKAVEDEIIARLDSGDVWAWASVHCIASFQGFTGDDYLGACSYRDTEDFIEPGGYWDDMKSEARQDLINKLEKAGVALKLLHS